MATSLFLFFGIVGIILALAGIGLCWDYWENRFNRLSDKWRAEDSERMTRRTDA